MTDPTPSPLPALSHGVAAWADWYVRMGVLDCVAEPGIERRASAPPAPPAQPVSPPETSRPAPLVPIDRLPESGPVATARATAQDCRSLDELEAALRRFTGCALAETATRLCFADGSRTAPLMLVGEAPGAEEDRQGKPFVGPSGQLLDRMLDAIGLGRGDVYITNLIYWRPPGNRSPTSSEIATCLPFLERQIAILRPKILVSVGGVAARALLDLKDGPTRARGRRFTYQPADGGAPVPTYVIFHPAYLLRQPLQKRLAWRDLLQIRGEMRALGLEPARRGGDAAWR